MKNLESPDLVEDLLIMLKYRIRYSLAGSKEFGPVL
jgi:hypothetical protein